MSRIVRHGALVGRWLAARLGIASERGATAVEYGLIVMLIAAAVIVAVAVLGGATNDEFDCTGDSWMAQSNQC